MWHIFWRGYSRLRSGREHLAWILAVEVRQGTLGVDGRGWGPAGNTGRGYPRLRSGREHWRWWSWLRSGREHWRWWSWLRSGREHWEGWSWLRSDRDHCGRGSRLSRRRRGGGEEMRGEEEQATDIKSNNPHLAGGEWSNISLKNQRHTKI